MSGSYTEMDVSKIFTALFLLTEVYSAHGSCNATEGFPNARSVKSMEGLAHFDDGFEIEYRCDDGFTLVSSDGISICQNGRWTSIEFIQGCNGIPNADIYIVDKDGVMGKEPVTFVKHGQQVSIQCKEHFTLYKDGAFYDTDGTSSTCAVGSWSHAYSCKKDSCCLQVPDNGYLEINGARREDAIRIDSGFEGSIVCEEGFAFYDNDRQELFEHFPVTCLGHTLNASIPKCVKEPTCPKLEPVYNGVIYYQNDDVISLYHVAEIECNDGSDVFPEGTRFVTCVEGNTWDVNNITCERHLTISPPSHMKLYTGQGRYRSRITSSRRLKSRTSLHVECEYKHELVDGKTNKYYEVNSLQVRIFNGTVVPELPLCRKERCNLVADHCSFMDTDGNKLVGKVEHNAVVVKMCDPDFEFEPSYKRKEPSQRSTCNQGGISFPRCIPKRCEIPADRRAKLYGRNANAGDLIQSSQTVERTCSGKRELFYPETQIYEENSNIFSSTCKIGVWSNGVFPICKEKRCNIVIDHCSFMDTDGNNLDGKVEHNTVVVKKCDPGFEFEPSDKRKEPNQKSTCDRGVIDFPRCISKRCEIPHDRHARIGKDIYTADELVDSEEQVVVDCREREEVYYPESNTYAKTFTTTCISGLWSDDKFPICKEERCSSPNESDGTRFLLDEKVVQNGDKLEHGTILTKSCNKGYEDKTNLPTKCSSGSWINDEPCTGKPCTLPAIEHTRDNEIPKQLAHNGQVRVECKNGYDMIGSDVANQNIKTNCIKGNLAPSLDNIKCVPKEFYYDYPDIEFYYDYPDIDEVKPEETCPNPANGRLVRSYLSYYNVVCDDGYELYVDENDDDYKCSNGKWMSKNFGFEAECNENDCEITDEILAIMKVFNRVNGKEQYESRVRKITPNQKYYFDCKQENHEPVKRLFNCSRGNWTAIERDPNWKMQIDGMEPSCRKALCDPVCQFGGTCVKDGMCKCVPGTTGKACEIPVCNPACASNGGKCEAPNTCKCEEPRYGINCEQVGCDRPNFPVHVNMKGTKKFFEDGDVLSSDQLTCSKGFILSNTIRCIGNLTWSGKAECLKETHYGLEVKVGTSKWAGSYGQLYVTILSEQGGIIHRMAFEKPDFEGLYPGQLYVISSTSGQNGKVGQLKLFLRQGELDRNDNLEIDHVRLTIQRDADNTKKEYDFSSVGWLNKNQQKLVGPDTGVFRLKYRLGDKYYAGSRDTLHISFEGNLGRTPFYLMSRGQRNKGHTYYKVIDGEYVGQIHAITIENDDFVKNDMQIEYINLTVSHEDKEEEYTFRTVGWIGSRKEIQPEITADQPEMPSCQDDFEFSAGWIDTSKLLSHSGFTKPEYVKSDEECKNRCRKDGRCRVAAVRDFHERLTCQIVYTGWESAVTYRKKAQGFRLYTRKC